MKKSLSIFFLIVLLSSSAWSVQSTLKVSERFYDFGSVGVDYPIFHTFMLYNTGKTPITVDSILAPCECSHIIFIDSTIAPGDSSAIHLTFNTEKFFGKTVKTLYIYSGQLETIVQFSANIGRWVKGLKPDPISVFFIPGYKTKSVSFTNDSFDFYEIQELKVYDDKLFEVIPVSKQASKGEKLVLEVKPRENITAGNHYSSFRIGFKVKDKEEIFYVTVPVKIVRY